MKITMEIINKIKRFFYSTYITLVKPIVVPIERQVPFFIILYTLLMSLDIFQMIFVSSYIPIAKTLYGIMVCYIIVLPSLFIKQKYRIYYQTLVISISTLLFIIDLGLLFLYGATFSTFLPDAIIVVRETNLQEILEFINTYLTFGMLLVLIAVPIILFMLFYWGNKIRIRFNTTVSILSFLLLTLSSIFYVKLLSKYKENNYYLLFTMKKPNLTEYRQTPKVSHTENRPSNIVLIIGESFSKLHSSLYGYEKQTNPLLGALLKEDELVLYHNIRSSATYTVLSFRGMMMSYADDICDSADWYKRLTIFDVMKSAGYNSYWISNQYKHDEIGRYSKLCDNSYFVSDYNNKLEKYHTDEKILPLIEQCIQNDTKKNNFFIVHLQGSHVDYIKRYPVNYSHFCAENYDVSHHRLDDKNKKIMAQYDNSVLYNDSIVYSIIQQFKDKDAIVIYLSDHGEELFETDNNFFGHGVTSNPEIVLDVPFMIHTTSMFKERHKALKEKIDNQSHKDYRLDSLMYTIMDIAGVETVDDTSYKHKSIFN